MRKPAFSQGKTRVFVGFQKVTPTGLETETANRWQETTCSNATRDLAGVGLATGARDPDSDGIRRIEISLDGREVQLTEAARARIAEVLSGELSVASCKVAALQ